MPLLYTPYPVTPTLSLEAVQPIEMVVVVRVTSATPLGTVGA